MSLTLLTILAVLVVLSPIILIHEAGHFLACKIFGIRVEEFAFGLGKKLYSKKKGDTEFTIRAVPFGGFVRTSGEMFLAADAPAPQSYEFAAKKWWKKLIMVISGAAMNYVLAFLIFAGVAYVVGTQIVDAKNVNAAQLPAVIGALVQDRPAAKHGLAEGDELLSINDFKLSSWQDLTENIAKTTGDVSVIFARGGEEKNIVIPSDAFGEERLLGVYPRVATERISLSNALYYGAERCWYWTSMSISVIYKSIVKGKAPDLAGPVGIVNIVHNTVKTHDVAKFIMLIGILSLAVGMFNLFPIPVLDGGYAVMFLIEGVTGKQMGIKTVERSINIGFALIMLLVIYATFGDVKRIFFKPKPAVEMTVEQADL